MAGSPYKDSSTRMCVYMITSIHRQIGVTQSMRLFWNLSACSRICPVQFILSFTPAVSFTAAIISVSFISAPSLHLLPIFLTPPEIWFLKRQSTENVCQSVLGMQIETSKQVTANHHLGFKTIFLFAGKYLIAGLIHLQQVYTAPFSRNFAIIN